MFSLSLSLSLVAAAGCAADTISPPEIKSDVARDEAPGVPAAQLSTFVDGTTQFALDLYGQVRATPGNVIMSPISVTEALGMTYAGAAGDTAAQMKQALHFTLPDGTTQAAMDQVDLDLAAAGDQVHVANNLWGAKGLTFEKPFLDTLASDYGAGVFVQDFAKDPEGSRDTINRYVSQETDGKIADLLPDGDITSDTLFVLTNAIYLQAKWQTPFDPKNTSPGAFTRDDGSVVQAPMMFGGDAASYGTGSDFVAGELAYKDSQLAMDVVEPTDHAPGALGRFEASLDAGKLAAVIASLTDTASVTMPKVEYSSAFDLVQALEALGMTDAFTAADFSAMSSTPIVLSDVVHQGYLAIDENGTTAAGATGVVGTGAAPENPNELVLDHPYLVVIRDKASGAVLFLGHVADPTAK